MKRLASIAAPAFGSELERALGCFVGDKSPKSKDKAKKQGAATDKAKKDAANAKAAKQSSATAANKKGK